MLIPKGLFNVIEYDAVFTITPTSKFGHNSDTVLGSVEMLVQNTEQEEINFPFVVLSTDSGEGAESKRSVELHTLNGSRPVSMESDEVDEVELAEMMVQRAQAAGVSDPAELDQVRNWAITALAKAERIKVGRTKIKAGETRRIILQQRLRIKPQDDGLYVLETIAPSPAATLATGGRVSLVVLLPWADDDVKPEIVEATDGFEQERGTIKQRQWIAWHWRNDPVFRVVYKYA